MNSPKPPVIQQQNLPWDNSILRKTDILALILLILLAIPISLYKIKIDTSGNMVPTDITQIDRRVLLPPPVVKAPPKPEVVEKKEVVKEKPPIAKETLDKAKPIPQAAKPVKEEEVKASAPKPSKAETVNTNPDSPQKSNTTVITEPVNTSPIPNPNAGSGSVDAARVEKAREKARSAVLDTGLANAVSDLDTIDVGSVNSKNLDMTGRNATSTGTGGKKVTLDKNGTGYGTGTAAGTRTKGQGGSQFGPATVGDKTGTGSGDLSARATSKAEGEIKDKRNAVGSTSTKAKEDDAKEDKAGGKRTDFNRVMAGAQGRIQSAYQRELDNDPTLEGSVIVKVKVSGDGNVSNVSTSGSLNNSVLESKIASIVRNLNFAGGFDAFEGTYTYNLTPP